MFFVSLFGALGAIVAIWAAYLTKYASCEPECPGGLYDVQLVVAFVGGIPVGFMVWAAFTNRLRLALVLLVVSLATYAAWGLLNDAAVHPGDEWLTGAVTFP